MSAESVFTVPDAISFAEAIALTESLLDAMERGEASESVIQQTIHGLAASENGARGFFVTYLSDQRLLANQPTPAVVEALGSSPHIVSPLLVKNLAMSTAMAITHRQNQDEAMAQGSDQVRSRTHQLIQLLNLFQVQEEANQLRASIQTGTGKYQPFLERWGYDSEQKQAINSALEQAGLVGSST